MSIETTMGDKMNEVQKKIMALTNERNNVVIEFEKFKQDQMKSVEETTITQQRLQTLQVKHEQELKQKIEQKRKSKHNNLTKTTK